MKQQAPLRSAPHTHCTTDSCHVSTRTDDPNTSAHRHAAPPPSFFLALATAHAEWKRTTLSAAHTNQQQENLCMWVRLVVSRAPHGCQGHPGTMDCPLKARQRLHGDQHRNNQLRVFQRVTSKSEITGPTVGHDDNCSAFGSASTPIPTVHTHTPADTHAHCSQHLCTSHLAVDKVEPGLVSASCLSISG
jgi:hypothetical protein